MTRQPSGNPCPVNRILRVVMGTWTTYILWNLHRLGTLRFGELRAAIPDISAKVLTERLRMLEHEGLVHRDYTPTIPPQVAYSLTDKGRELHEVLDGLAALAVKWQSEAPRHE
ncbi:winged helix-turn-helix transcriptional regulator [Paludibacterium paludis]|uniref:HxlR family transcriptional regulator n=1 Tax=Paludibacterium paludis TaxID=1225769 RepID=A0A918P4N9_9NEIS|nr:helix-turn-helix domain-containing protein [Paludibacterium paludis]GGY20999.1 HxlR family transcriptional regulator [Paludibacterium paludis]